MDCRVKTYEKEADKKKLMKVSILDLMDCRVKTESGLEQCRGILQFQSLI